MIEIKAQKDLGTVVQWQLSKFCEKNCHYCTAYDFMLSLKTGVHVHYEPEVLKYHEHIKELLISGIDHGQILLFGGEPTLHPNGIEYFNEMCRRTGPDVMILLTTHGDISVDKINQFNPGNKKEHIVAVSYHHYQVNFEEWWTKVQMLNKRVNVMVSSIIPRRPRVWDAWKRNMDIVLDSGIVVEFKPELKKEDNTIDPISVSAFKDYVIAGEQTIRSASFTQSGLSEWIDISDGNSKVRIPRSGLADEIRLQPGKTICNNKNHMIVDNTLYVACGQGQPQTINKDTTVEEFKRYINSPPIICRNTTCQGDRYNPPHIKILNADLKSWT